MQAGPMRNRITIQRPLAATDPFQTSGQAAWENVISVWSKIESINQQQSFNNDQQTMKITHLITIRYPGAGYQIGAGYQVLYGSRVFSIVEGIVNEDERNRTLILRVWEINPSAGG